MNTLQAYRMVWAAVICAAIGIATADETETKTVDALHPNLATGALTYAQPADLPDGVLLTAEGVHITREQIEETIAQQPPHVRTMLAKEMFYVLEQEAAGKLLVRAARKALDGQGRNLEGMSDEQLINTLFDQMTEDVTTTEADQQAFYQDNPHFFHGAPFERVQPMIAQYLAQEKKQHRVDDYIKTLGQQMTIEVAGDWTQQQARAAQENPLDKARQGGTPTVALFYAASPCCPDATAAELAAVDREIGSRLNVVSLNPNTEPILAARYGVRSNPALLFFDAEGREISRHQGSMNRAEITTQLADIGVN